MEILAFDDARFLAMMDRLRLTEPEALCDSGNRIAKVCANPNCEIAMRCSNFFCRHCGLNAHPTCMSFDLPYLTHALNSRIESHKEMVTAVINMDNQLITAIEASKGLLANEYKERILSPEIQNIINKIYRERSLRQISGREGNLLLEQMADIGSSSKEQMTSLVNSYKKSIEEIIQEITKLKQALFEGQPSAIDSKILTQKDPATPQNLQFISEALGKYQKMQLLYRGSENNFRAAAFHEKCGEAENTLTLVRTEFGRTIAAFTPYKWHSVPNNSYVSNAAGGTCILSLDRREKLIPLNNHYLIHNSSSYGPLFGGGGDLRICDQCNISRNSSTCVGSYYNTVDKKYKNDQATWATFSGGAQGYNFLVVEYEVFRVIR